MGGAPGVVVAVVGLIVSDCTIDGDEGWSCLDDRAFIDGEGDAFLDDGRDRRLPGRTALKNFMTVPGSF